MKNLFETSIQESVVTSKASGQVIPLNHSFTMENFEYYKRNDIESFFCGLHVITKVIG